jgi:AcrR family transcriptional regulator
MITKQQILDESAELFKSYGLKSITMDDISSHLGISKKTLYQLIPEKNQMIEELIIQEYQNLKLGFEQIASESSDVIEELIRFNIFIIQFLQQIQPVAIFDLKKYHHNLYQNWGLKFKEQIAQTIIQNLQLGKQANLYRANVNEPLIAKLHTERIDQMQNANKLWGNIADTREAIKEMTTFYLRGLITPEGEKLFNTHIEKFENYFK